MANSGFESFSSLRDLSPLVSWLSADMPDSKLLVVLIRYKHLDEEFTIFAFQTMRLQ